jgi:hypothetical protein
LVKECANDYGSLFHLLENCQYSVWFFGYVEACATNSSWASGDNFGWVTWLGASNRIAVRRCNMIIS